MASIATFSAVYTFPMAVHIFVQLRGVEKPAEIEASEVENTSTHTEDPSGKLLLKSGDKLVAEFRASEVIGWWKQTKLRGQ